MIPLHIPDSLYAAELQLNYILKTRKQSQDIAIVIDDVVIL